MYKCSLRQKLRQPWDVRNSCMHVYCCALIFLQEMEFTSLCLLWNDYSRATVYNQRNIDVAYVFKKFKLRKEGRLDSQEVSLATALIGYLFTTRLPDRLLGRIKNILLIFYTMLPRQYRITAHKLWVTLVNHKVRPLFLWIIIFNKNYFKIKWSKMNITDIHMHVLETSLWKLDRSLIWHNLPHV